MVIYIPLVIMILVCCYVYYKKLDKEIVLKLILAFVVFNVIMSVDLGINYACSKGFNDGVSINGIISKFVFIQNREWSIENFRMKYFTSMYINFAMLVFYIMNILFLRKSRKEN